MNENELQQENEISLFDLWETLREGWKRVVGGTALGLAGAVVAIILLAPKYEAVAVVQVGQVGQVGQAAPLQVEAPAQAIERLKSSSFQLSVAEDLGDQEWKELLLSSSTATTRHLAVQVMKTAPVIELKVSASSPEQAKSIAEATIKGLARKQDEIAKPMVDKMKADLSITKEKLASAKKGLETLSKMAMNAVVKDERFTQLSLITSLRVQKDAEVFGLRQTIMAYETALMPPATQPVKALEPVYVASKPVSPQKPLLIALGLVGGLLVGVMWVFVANAWRRAQTERKVS